jgi:hypothetical protein
LHFITPPMPAQFFICCNLSSRTFAAQNISRIFVTISAFLSLFQ